MPRWRPIERLVLAALVILDLALIAQVLVVASGRLTYPFELEWGEGFTIENAWRIVHGLPIYGPTDASFAPGYYPPLHYLVALPVLLVTHWSLAGARLVSWLALVGWGLVAAYVIRRTGGSWVAVLVGFGFAAGFYRATGYWYDVARVDMLAAFLATAGIAAVGSDDRPSDRRLVLGAIALLCGVATKQTIAPIAAAAAAYFFLAGEWRRGLVMAATFAGVGIVVTAVLWVWTGGWITLVYTMPRHHRLDPSALSRYASFLWPAIPMSVVAVAGAGRRTVRVFLLATAAALAMGALAFCKVGGHPNSTLPAISLLAVGGAVAAADLWRRLADSNPGRALRVVAALALIAVPLRAGALSMTSLAMIPSASDRRDARDLWDDMRAVDGDFFAYGFGFSSVVLRGRTWAASDRLFDVAGGYDDGPFFWNPDVQRYPADLLAAVRERRFPAIYGNGAPPNLEPIGALIEQHYVPARRFGPPEPAPGAAGWWVCTPRVKLVPRPD